MLVRVIPHKAKLFDKIQNAETRPDLVVPKRMSYQNKCEKVQKSPVGLHECDINHFEKYKKCCIAQERDDVGKGYIYLYMNQVQSNRKNCTITNYNGFFDAILKDRSVMWGY